MPSPGITKKIIAGTMKELLSKRPLSKISVGDIVERCEINRNTFYYHFKDKYDVVNWIFYTEYIAEFSHDEVENIWQFIEHLCCFFYKDKDFYSNALMEQGTNSLSEYFTDLIKGTIRVRIEELTEDDLYADFYVNFFSDAFVICFSNWLIEGAKLPPETLARFVKKAVTETAIKLAYDNDENA